MTERPENGNDVDSTAIVKQDGATAKRFLPNWDAGFYMKLNP